jgi:curved DNA-binding protein CbpA
MKSRDPEGLYAALNVSPDASQQEIKLAYTFLKQAYRKGVRSVKIGKVREAYGRLGTPAERKKYDAGKQSRLPRLRRPDGTTALNSAPLLAGLALMLLVVTAFVFGPAVRARFVTFDPGTRLYWKDTGRTLGTVIKLERDHLFAEGRRGSAYQIDMGSGGEPVWFAATDLALNCGRR